MREKWKFIPGSDEYQASTLGRIRRIKILKPWDNPPYNNPRSKKMSPRPTVTVVLNGVPCKTYVHTLVALTFLGPRPEGLIINHKDSNAHNPRPDNLEYITQAENIRHAYRAGRIVQKGKKSPGSGKMKDREPGMKGLYD